MLGVWGVPQSGRWNGSRLDMRRLGRGKLLQGWTSMPFCKRLLLSVLRLSKCYWGQRFYLSSVRAFSTSGFKTA